MLPKPIKDEHTRVTSLTTETNVHVPMSDGTVLCADVYRPSGPGRWPVLLSRIPYGKHKPRYRALHLDPVRAASRGYVVVVQDVRGRHNSKGVFYPFRHEADDGFDTVEWCAAQPWSDGNVGMFGMSYHGATQWLAAIQAPPSLKAIAPGLTSDSYYDSWTYLGGVFQLWWTAEWAAGFARDSVIGTPPEKADAVAELRRWVKDPLAMSRHLPVKDMPALKGLADYYYDWLAHPTYDGYWKAMSPCERFDRVEVPVLNIGGYYDSFVRGTLRSLQGVVERGATGLARSQQHLLLGPWIHSHLLPPSAGQRYFGAAASGEALDYQGMVLSWSDRWLKGEDNGVDSDPKVYYFLMGANAWRTLDQWPPESREAAYFLRSSGRANASADDGALSLDPPKEYEVSDSYLYNPMNPVPTVGGPYIRGIPGLVQTGVEEQTPVERREDVLVYTSGPLDRDLEVTGNVTLALWAVTSAPDTDWTAKLTVVHPDGSSYNICEGILRASFRESLERTAPIEPGTAYQYQIDLGPTAMLFERGHRIRLQVSSSNFPAFARNLNTGGPVYEEKEARTAIQTVLHDANHPSRLVLPVVDS